MDGVSSLVRLVRRLRLMKYERKYSTRGFSSEPHTSRAQMAIWDTRTTGPRYAAFAVHEPSVTICYPSSIKSLLHPLKISSCTPSTAISEPKVARYCNLTCDPALPTQLYLNTHAVGLSSRFRYRTVLTTSRHSWLCFDHDFWWARIEMYRRRWRLDMGKCTMCDVGDVCWWINRFRWERFRALQWLITGGKYFGQSLSYFNFNLLRMICNVIW